MVEGNKLDDTLIRASAVVCVGIVFFIAGRLSLNLFLFDMGLLLMIIGLLGIEFVIFICLIDKVEHE